MKTLTKRQEEILNLIKSHISDFGFPPTRADIARTLGFKSPNAAEQHLRAIEKKGFISILSGASRGIVLSNAENDEIPVIGLVAAGGPILAEENVEKTIPRSKNFCDSSEKITESPSNATRKSSFSVIFFFEGMILAEAIPFSIDDLQS